MTRAAYEVALRGDAAVLDALPFGQGPATPFQTRAWLACWYAAFCAQTDHAPLIAFVLDRARPDAPLAERLVMAMPLVQRRRRGLPLVEWADRGVTDVNLPLFGPRPMDDVDAALDAVARAVRPYARLTWRKMPRASAGVDNPLAAATRARPEEIETFHLPLGGARKSLAAHLGSKKVRVLRRAKRILAETGHEPVFRFARSPAERRAILHLIARSQSARHGDETGYLLDDPIYAGFYDALVAQDRDGEGLARLAAIWLEDRPIAGLLILVAYGRYVCVRLGMVDDPEIEKAGPGRLVVFEAAGWAADAGAQVLDLSLGANALKAWFRCEPQPLVKVTRYANGLV